MKLRQVKGPSPHDSAWPLVTQGCHSEKEEGVGAYFCWPALPQETRLPYLWRLSQDKHQGQPLVYLKGRAYGLVPRQTQARRARPLTGNGAEQHGQAFRLPGLKLLCARQLLFHLSFTSLLRGRRQAPSFPIYC